VSLKFKRLYYVLLPPDMIFAGFKADDCASY